MEGACGTGRSQGTNIMNSNAELLKVDHQISSLADLSLPCRISTLIALAKRFGPVLPVFGVVAVDGNWMCECGEASCKAGKHPRIKSWVTRATKDTGQIADWAMRWPLANWAIHCSEINVVDLDRKPGKPDGVITLACWEDALGVTTPDSVRVTTGTGIQIYFRPGGLKTTANPDGTGIDVRAAGGYVMAPGSRHPNGRIYQIDLDEELAPCPEWLIESLTVRAPHEGTQEWSSAPSFKRNSTPYSKSGEGGGFWLDPAAKLNAWEVLRIEQLCQRKPKLAATWAMDRRNRFQFQGGRNSPSEYEGALSFYLRQDGWNPQQIMDAITVWRREHDLPAPKYHSRYRATIGKAVSLVTVNPMVVKEPKRAWKPGEPEAGLLDALPGAPRRPGAVVGLDGAAVRMALTSRARPALHVGREYLAVPVAAVEETTAPAVVPSYDPDDDPFAVPNDWTWQPGLGVVNAGTACRKGSPDQTQIRT
jgi:Bifunctional DNA primase/polymerase, N-terminal